MNKVDVSLYVAIAMLGAAQGYVGHGIPVVVAPALGILMAGAVAWKAKRSVGTVADPKAEVLDQIRKGTYGG